MNFHGLNQKQQSVAKELEQNILLLASAGTGKTNTLAYRIENILDKKLAKPEEIVCLTFTSGNYCHDQLCAREEQCGEY